MMSSEVKRKHWLQWAAVGCISLIIGGAVLAVLHEIFGDPNQSAISLLFVGGVLGGGALYAILNWGYARLTAKARGRPVACFLLALPLWAAAALPALLFLAVYRPDLATYVVVGGSDAGRTFTVDQNGGLLVLAALWVLFGAITGWRVVMNGFAPPPSPLAAAAVSDDPVAVAAPKALGDSSEGPAPPLIRFQCPKCTKRIKAPAQSVGRNARCTLCGASIRVPSPN